MEQFSEELKPIFARRSVREFTGELVPRAEIVELLTAAMAAPSARCMDPWFFSVFNGEFCEKVVPALANGEVLVSAQNGILVCADVKNACGGELSYAIQDCSAAIENFLIAASLRRLGACWMGIHPREERITGIKYIFDLPDHLTPIAVIAFGYPREVGLPRSRYDEKKIHWNI